MSWKKKNLLNRLTNRRNRELRRFDELVIFIDYSSQYYVGPSSDISEEDLAELPSCVYAGRSTQHVAHTSSHTHSPLHYHMPVSTPGNLKKDQIQNPDFMYFRISYNRLSLVGAKNK